MHEEILIEVGTGNTQIKTTTIRQTRRKTDDNKHLGDKRSEIRRRDCSLSIQGNKRDGFLGR